jgi:uncharacterized iron-regulated membrane protein
LNTKKAIRTIHLLLGLSSGFLVFVIAITGCMYAFKTEIENFTQPYRFVEEQAKEFVLPTKIISIAQKELPGKKIHAVLYQGKKNAAKAIFYSNEEHYYYFVYINQYTGEVLKVRDEYKTFFSFILDGHFYLWLPNKIGQPLVASATLIFFAMLISGIILWIPKNKNVAKQRFKIKWNATWRRKNFDMHSVIGFYVSWAALVLVITGLVWGFQWFTKAYYYTISGGNELIEYENPVSKPLLNNQLQFLPIDNVWLKLSAENPVESAIEIHPPADLLSSIAANINPDPSTYWKIDYRYFDQYTIEELPVKHMWGRFKDASTSTKLMRMNYDIHVGAILGLPGKILAFFTSLLIASLPITGCMLWYGKRNKKKTETPVYELENNRELILLHT